MKYFLFSVCMLVVLFSCKKESTSNKPGTEYFPNSTGNYWKYKVTDSLSKSTNIVEVKIIGEKLLPGGQNAKTWLYIFPNHTDTNYIYQTSNTVIFLDNNFEICKRYIVPLQVNSKWPLLRPYYYTNDSIQVIENSTFILNNHTYENSFSLYESGYLPNASLEIPEWFCPTIGMVTKTEKCYDRIGAAYVKYLQWELIEFNLR